jgi:hypothetical protein
MARILSIDEGTTGVRGVIVDESTGRRWAAGTASSPSTSPAPAGSSTTPPRSGRRRSRPAGTRWRCDRHRPGRRHLRRDHQPARDDRRLGPPVRPTDPPRHRLAGPPHRGHLRPAEDGRPRRRRPAVTGLVIDAYFSGTKVAWLLDEVEGRATRRGGRPRLRHDGHLARVEPDGGRVHATEPSNACRTMLYDLRGGGWSDAMLDLLDVPAAVLPEVRDSAGEFGRTTRTRSSGSTLRSPGSPATSRRRCSARAAGSPACRRTPTAPGRSCC